MEKQYLSDSDVGFGSNQASGGQSKAAPKYLSDSDVGFGPAGSDGPLARGWNKTKQSVAITGQLAAGDTAGAAKTIRQADDYARANPSMREGRELGEAWERGDGVLGGLKEVAGEFKKDWQEAPGVVAGLRATGRNLRAFGEGAIEQVPNMLPSVTGMVGGAAAGGAAGSAVPIVGNVAGAIAGGWLGSSAGNTLVEGGGQAQDALQKAGINPQDTQAVERYLKEHGDKILGQSAVKGSIIGAVDTLTAGLGGKILNAPARAAANRALAELGVDMADKAAVSAAMKTPEFAARVAGDAAYQASRQGAGNVARNVGAAALDPAGEFTGEYVGQGVATGDWDTKNAALEAFSSIGQSAGMYAGQKAYQSATNPLRGNRSDAANPSGEHANPAQESAPELLRLGNSPDPLAIFPDGTVGRRAEVEAYVNSLPEDQRIAARAKLQGLGLQPADVTQADPAVARAQQEQGNPQAPQTTPLPSEAMGLRSGPEAGTLERAGAMSVDTGATAQMQQDAQAEAPQRTDSPVLDYAGLGDADRAAYDDYFNSVSEQTDDHLAASINDDDIPDFGDTSNVSEADFLRRLGASEQEILDALQITSPAGGPQASAVGAAEAQANDASGARALAGPDSRPGASQEGQQSVAPSAAELKAELSADRDTAAEDAIADDAFARVSEGAAFDENTPTGAASEPQAAQAQPIQAQQPQAGGAAPVGRAAAAVDASPAPAGGSGLQTGGLSSAAPTQNPGAQAAPAAGPAGETPFTTVTTAKGTYSVRPADLNGDAPSLATYTAEGKKRAVKVKRADLEPAQATPYEAMSPEQQSAFDARHGMAPGQREAVAAKQASVEDQARQAKADGQAWVGMTPDQRRRARLEREIATGTTNNGGVVAQLRPASIEKRRQELSAMGDAGRVPGGQQTDAAGDLRGFRSTAAAAVQSGMRKTLGAKVRHGGKSLTRKEWIEQKVADGATLTQGAGGLQLRSADGTYLDEGVLTKTGMDYARHLLDGATSTKNGAAAQGQPTDFIPAPDGGVDYGEITPEMAKAMRRQAGKVRLQQGVQNADGTGWGLAHIEANHGQQIRAMGYGSISDFVAESVRDIDQIWQAGNTIQLVVAHTGKASRVTFLQLEIQKDGDFYRVNTAFPVSQTYLEGKEKKAGWKPLWSRYPVPADASGASGFAGQPPSAGEAAPMVSNQSGNASVPPAAKDAKPSVLRPADAQDGAKRGVVGVAQADQIARAILGRAGLSEKTIATVESFSALPKDMQEEAKAQGKEGQIKGALHGSSGVIYLVADQHTSAADVKETVLHELMGHKGVRALFGRDYVSAMNRLFAAMGGWDGAKRIAKGRGMLEQLQDYRQTLFGEGRPDWSQDMRIAVLTDELMAAIAQKPTLLDRAKEVIGAIRQWLRDHGFAELAAYGETDLLRVLQQGRQVMRERAAAPAGKTVFLGKAKEVTPEQRAQNFSRWSSDAPLVSSDQAEQHDFKTGQKIVVEAFHGTARPDRIGAVFDPKRATSGPMAFFTSSPELASSYSTGKADTSLSDEDQQYANWFKFKPQGARSSVPIDRAWALLTPEQRERVRELAPQVRLDDDSEGVVLDSDAKDGLGNYQWELQQTRTSWDRGGNPLKALAESWLTSGTLFGDERKFLDVLRLAGFPVKDVTADFPTDSFPGVFKTFISMKSPLVVSDMPAEVRDALERAAKSDRSRAKPGADMWDKRSHTLRDWWAKFSDPDPSVATYAWTSIPDKVTDILKSYGFDGIVDWSGKGGGHQAPVYIPFAPNQVKSFFNRGTFDPTKKDITHFGASKDGTEAMSPAVANAMRALSQPRPVDSAVLGMVREGRSARDILSLVAGTSKSRFNRQVARLLLKTGVNPTMRLDNTDMGGEQGFKFLAKYSRASNAITMTEGALRQAEQIFLHEMIHAATLKALDRKGLQSLQMRRLFEHVKKQGGPDLLRQYGMKNVGEFVAEAFTNPQFQRALRQMDAPSGGGLKSAWDGFVRILRSILGLPQDGHDALSQALEIGVNVMREDKALRERGVRAGPVGDAYAQSPSTRANFESRIDALFNGGKATTGTRVLDRSDVMALLGYPDVPLMLNERHLLDGLTNHPEMTATAWKKVPGWLENPSMVYRDPRDSGRLVVIAPDALAGYPVMLVVEPKPNPAGSRPAPAVPTESLLVTVYAKTSGNLPAPGFLASSGNLLYVDTKNAPEVARRGGVQFPKQAALLQGRQKILTEKNLAGWRKTNAGESDDAHFGAADLGRAAKNIGDGLGGITAASVKKAGKHKLTDWLSLGLQFLGRRQLVEVYGDTLPMAEYDLLAAQMEADKNDVGAAADELARRWGKLPDEAKLADLMHEATLAQIDADASVAAVTGDDRAQGAVLKGRFKALSPEAQQVYREARDSYKAHYEQVRQAIRDRIERSELSSKKRHELLEKMDADFFKKVKGVYFPLARFGQYVVAVKDAGGQVVSVSRAETMLEADAMREEMRKAFPAAQGFDVGRVTLGKDFVANHQMVGRGFMSDLYAALEKQDIPHDQLLELEDTLGQLYLSSLPDLSWAKHGIHRKGTPGFSQDARRAFAQNTFHGARYLAKLRYGDLMQSELDRMQKHVEDWSVVEDFDQPKAQRVVNEMMKRHDALMNPKGNPLSTALTSAGFIYYLGLSPAAAAVNLSQTALVAYPVMAGKWGYKKSAEALMKASAETVAGKNNLRGQLKDADEVSAYDEAVRTGVIDVTQAHDLAGIAQGEDAKVMWTLRPVMRAASFLFHHAERFNRQATFIAAYRLAKETGVGHLKAYEQAAKATYDGHFDYSSGNRPRVMQGNVARVVLLFKQFAQNMIFTLGRQAYQSVAGESPQVRKEARKVFAGLITMHAAAAGVLGLPLVGPLLAVASALGGDDDEPWDAEAALRNMMAEAFGPKVSEVLAKGFSRLTPWDISGRVGLNNLIFPDVREGLEGQRWAETFATGMLGPVIGIGVNAAKGAQKIADGDYRRALEDILPVAARNPIKSARYWFDGAQDRSGIAIKDDVSAAGAAGQLLGFSPSEVRLAFEGKSAVMDADRRLNAHRSDLIGAFAKAAMRQDRDAMAHADDAIRAFNDKNPGRRITAPQKWQSVRARQRRIDQAENGVYLPRNRRDALEAGAFAFES